MAPIGTLWGDARQRQTKVILSVAALNGLEITQPVTQFSFSNKPAEFVSKFPYGKIPVFEDANGWKLSEGTPIARYLSEIGSNVNLLGTNAEENALIDQWVHFAEYEIDAPTYGARTVIYQLIGSFDRERLDKHIERLERALAHLEEYLAARPSGYLVSDRLTFADLVVVGVVYNASLASLGAAERAKYKHIFAHYTKVTQDERIKEYWGTEGFTDVAITEPRTFTLS